MRNHIKTASYIADLLDNRFKILGFRFGIDPLLGLIPGGGDLVSFALSLYMIWIGVKIELPQTKVIKMIKNTTFDLLVGVIPVLGDIADFTYKSNLTNLGILQAHVGKDAIDGEIMG